MIIPGEQLERLCSEGRQEILLVAPFIKAATLARLLDQIRSDVVVNCVTRWRPEEIAAGVSDLDTWPLLRDRPNSTLWLRGNLHAKYYRADARCLVGSANLTGAALGWSAQPNLELLVDLPAHAPQCVDFERELWLSAITVDDDLHALMADAVAAIQVDLPSLIIAEARETYVVSLPAQATQPGTWTPSLRHPEDLFLAYSGRSDELSSASAENARADLLALNVSLGLSKIAFTRSVGALLLQHPIVRHIDIFLNRPQRFGAVRDELGRLPCANSPDFDPTLAWQTLMRWLFYFLPARYTRLPSRHSEVVGRAISNLKSTSPPA